jgi:hypothetical protein
MKHAIPDEILASHTAVLGMTGSGKTSTEKLIVEQVAENFRVCVLDTIKSDWWGITSSASGKSAGLPFKILGGPRGHVPLHSSAGKVIGQLVGTGKLPLSIIDMADFEAGGIQRFFVDFAQSLWKNIRGVVYLVIEEAHEIAPKERVGFGGENMSIHWAKKLGTGSRTKGIRLIVATQRVQALHNAVLGSCQTLIAHQLMFDADQEPVIKWLKGVNKSAAAEVSGTLASLQTGEGWLCSGRTQLFQRTKFPKFRTFDNTATPTGDDDQFDVKMAPVDEAALRALIGEEVAKAEADDPKKLRERISVLERDKRKLEQERDGARSAAPSAPSREGLLEAEARGYQLGFAEAAKQGKESYAALKHQVQTTVRTFTESLQTNVGATNLEFINPETGSPAVTRSTAAPTPRAAVPAARKPSPVASGDASLSNPQRTLLRALAWWRAMGFDNPSRAQVAAIAGWKVTAGHLKNVIGSLNSAGLTLSAGGHVALTDAGEAAAPEPDMSLTLVDGLRDVLSNPQKQIFEVLLTRNAMSRAEVAEAVGWDPKAGHLKNVIGSMRTLEIIDYPSGGMVELQSWVRA